LDVEFPPKDYIQSLLSYHEPYLKRHDISPLNYAKYNYGSHNIWGENIPKMTIYIFTVSSVLADNVTIGGTAINELNDEATITIGSAQYGSLLYENVATEHYYAYTEYNNLKIAMQNVNPDVLDELRIFTRFFNSDDYTIYGPYENQFGDINEGWIWDRALIYENISDIRLFTKDQIRLFINFFYAIHGYNFTNPKYKNYFKSIETFFDKNNTNYTVNSHFSADNFNEFERKNIDYLVLLERKLNSLH
jgi:hypothetical protein